MGKKKPKHDSGLFLTIVGVLAVPLVYVLQANGVVDIGWKFSLVIYALILAIFVWAYGKWEKPSNWSCGKSYAVSCCIAAPIIIVSYLGVAKQYKKDQRSTLEIEGSIMSWGAASDFQIRLNPRVVIGTPRSEVVVNGSLLRGFADKYKIVMVINKNDGTNTILDRVLDKSAAYDIRDGPIPISVLWHDEFMNIGVST